MDRASAPVNQVHCHDVSNFHVAVNQLSIFPGYVLTICTLGAHEVGAHISPDSRMRGRQCATTFMFIEAQSIFRGYLLTFCTLGADEVGAHISPDSWMRGRQCAITFMFIEAQCNLCITFQYERSHLLKIIRWDSWMGASLLLSY